MRMHHALLALLLVAAPARAQSTVAMLDSVQHAAFQYFWNEANPSNGLVRDRSQPGSPASIAAVGFGLSSIAVGVDHGWVSRTDARNRVFTTLQTFWTGPQGTAANGMIGYKGLYYHFLDMSTAQRTWDCELSTIDTALLFAGILDAKQYFSTTDPTEVQIRALADSIYRRADWNFMRNSNPGILMGWKPGTGFSGYSMWIGYNEAMILYLLALGSPTHAVPTTAWNLWVAGYNGKWQTQYGQTYLIFAPLFGHQYSHCWVDFRLTRDAYMNTKGITYFENSRRASLASRAYSAANPGGFVAYSDSLWGLTASDDPDVGYIAHGAPPGENDNGTISPTAAASSIAFTPDESIVAIRHMLRDFPQVWGTYGLKDAFNPTQAWYDTDFLGIDQGPIVMMIENYRTGSIWTRMMRNADLLRGLQRAGFTTVADAGPIHGPSGVALDAGSPNPFTSSSTVRFRLPARAVVRLSAFDLEGREVARLVEGEREAGEHSVTLDGRRLPSGVYLVRLETGGLSFARRLVRIQ